MRIESLDLLLFISKNVQGSLLLFGKDSIPAFSGALPISTSIFLSCSEGEQKLDSLRNASVRYDCQWTSDDFWTTENLSPLPAPSNSLPVFVVDGEIPPSSAFTFLRGEGFTQILISEHGQWRRLDISRQEPQLAIRAKEATIKFIENVSSTSKSCRTALQKAFLKFFSKNIHDEGVTQFTHDGENLYKAYVPQLAQYSDKFANHKSRLFLFEEHSLLTPHQSHEAIRTVGCGRYAHWENDIYFSSTDNQDPNLAGRRYRYVLCTGVSLLLRPLIPVLFARVSSLVQAAQESAPVGPIARPKPNSARFYLARGKSLPKIDGISSFERAAATLLPANTQRGMESLLSGSTHEIDMIIGTLGPGGSERQLSYLTRGLRSRNFSVRVYTGNTSSPELLHYLPSIESSGATHSLYTVPHPNFKIDSLITPRGLEELALIQSMPPEFANEVWSLYTHLMINRPKVLHCWLDHTNIIGGIAGWLAGVPRIILSTRNVNPTHFAYIYREWYQKWYRLLATSPRVRLVANSLEGAKSYATWMKIPVSRFSIIHNGIDLNIIEEIPAEKAALLKTTEGIAKDAPLIAGIFRLSAEKQPKTFLAVVAEVRKSIPNVRAMIAGIGSMQEEVRKEIARLGLEGTVKLLGRRSDIPVVMSAADIVALTSSEEGFPNVLMEAQSLGRPVVCTAAGGIPEAVKHGHSGFVFKIGDVPALAKACCELLKNNELRQKMGGNARRWVRENFSSEQMIEKSLISYDLSKKELEEMTAETLKSGLNEGTRATAENTASLWTSANPFERKFAEAVDFDIRNAKSQLNFLPGGRTYAKGRVCMEIGPGQDIGIPLLIMGFGAKAYVIDKYLCHWDNAYHPKFYRELRKQAEIHFPDGDFRALDEVIANNDHRAEGLAILRLGLEEVSDAIPDNALDWSFSNATFEHLFDARAALMQLGRITKPDGLGFHQTDFRDHRNFSVPLEYITMPADEFTSMMHRVDCSCGNRLRYTDFIPWFQEAGFEVKLTPSLFADPDYLEEVLKRAQPEYKSMPREALQVLSGRFHLVKRSAKAVQVAA